MNIATIRLGKKAQVVIPKIVRNAVGLEIGKKATLGYRKGMADLLGDPKTYGTLLRGLGKKFGIKQAEERNNVCLQLTSLLFLTAT